ncbi:translation initiation factor IF-3 [Candidatus Gracilibacteria bacterium 28_42_T64]|nr:translation initiation factor IF-3 [Candidatus Gracilibacteria bacterium 28_42_T64]
MKDKKRILNRDIRARTVQLITDSGENLGEMSINEARVRAEEQSLDLMEMGKSGDVAIVKILDYGKFLYKQKKQDQKNKAKGKAPDLKTLRITFKIGEHDLDIRRKQAEKFGLAHHPLKITLMLRGRENQYTEIAEEKMTRFVMSLTEVYKLEGQVKKSGNTFSCMLKPIK